MTEHIARLQHALIEIENALQTGERLGIVSVNPSFEVNSAMVVQLTAKGRMTFSSLNPAQTSKA